MKTSHQLLAVLLVIAPSVRAQTLPSWEFQGRENFIDELAETLVKDKMVIVGLDTAVVESKRTVGRHDFSVLRLPQFTPSFPATTLFPAEPRSYNDAKP